MIYMSVNLFVFISKMEIIEILYNLKKKPNQTNTKGMDKLMNKPVCPS